MEENNLGNEIKNGFNALAGGFKEAGRRRIMELVSKQGYVAYRNLEAVNQFKADPMYKDWKCECIDGEYRFYPPKEQKQENDNANLNIIDTYKQAINNYQITTAISIIFLEEDSNKCEYRLIATDKQTGKKWDIQKVIIPFDEKFSMEILPSLYYHLSGGLPIIDDIKDIGDYNSVSFSNVSLDKIMYIGRVNEEHKKLIMDMKDFVDNKFNLKINTDVDDRSKTSFNRN